MVHPHPAFEDDAPSSRDLASCDSPLYVGVVAALKTVYDPEIPVDIYELGLIYKIDVAGESDDVTILMTLTAPGCPAADMIMSQLVTAVQSVDGVGDVSLKLTFDPPWDPSRMSDEARVALNMF